MKKLLIAALAALSLSAFADCEQMFAGHVAPTPTGNYQVLCRSRYAVIHDNDHKLPFMAAELLTPETIGVGKVKRTNNFRADHDLPKEARSVPKDYVGTIYDKGHLADAENMGTPEAMSESFLMSNMTPQVFSINRGPWRALEMRVAEWVRNGRTLIVYSGVILDGKQTIGSDVAVPTKLFKVIIDVNKHDAIAFVMPNVTGNIGDWKQYRFNVAEVEHIVGVNLLPGMPVAEANMIRNSTGLTLMPK